MGDRACGRQRINSIQSAPVARGNRNIGIGEHLRRFEGCVHEIVRIVTMPQAKGVAEFVSCHVSSPSVAEAQAKCLAAELDRSALQSTTERRESLRQCV